jgi:hypothetical protein
LINPAGDRQGVNSRSPAGRLWVLPSDDLAINPQVLLDGVPQQASDLGEGEVGAELCGIERGCVAGHSSSPLASNSNQAIVAVCFKFEASFWKE